MQNSTDHQENEGQISPSSLNKEEIVSNLDENDEIGLKDELESSKFGEQKERSINEDQKGFKLVQPDQEILGEKKFAGGNNPKSSFFRKKNRELEVQIIEDEIESGSFIENGRITFEKTKEMTSTRNMHILDSTTPTSRDRGNFHFERSVKAKDMKGGNAKEGVISDDIKEIEEEFNELLNRIKQRFQKSHFTMQFLLNEKREAESRLHDQIIQKQNRQKLSTSEGDEADLRPSDEVTLNEKRNSELKIHPGQLTCALNNLRKKSENIHERVEEINTSNLEDAQNNIHKSDSDFNNENKWEDPNLLGFSFETIERLAHFLQNYLRKIQESAKENNEEHKTQDEHKRDEILVNENNELCKINNIKNFFKLLKEFGWDEIQYLLEKNKQLHEENVSLKNNEKSYGIHQERSEEGEGDENDENVSVKELSGYGPDFCAASNDNEETNQGNMEENYGDWSLMSAESQTAKEIKNVDKFEEERENFLNQIASLKYELEQLKQEKVTTERLKEYYSNQITISAREKDEVKFILEKDYDELKKNLEKNQELYNNLQKQYQELNSRYIELQEEKSKNLKEMQSQENRRSLDEAICSIKNKNQALLTKLDISKKTQEILQETQQKLLNNREFFDQAVQLLEGKDKLEQKYKEEIKKQEEIWKFANATLEQKLRETEASFDKVQSEKLNLEMKYQTLIDENKKKLDEAINYLKTQNEDLSNNLSNKFEALKVTQDTIEETKLQLKNNNHLLTQALEILQEKLKNAEDMIQLKNEKEELKRKNMENSLSHGEFEEKYSQIEKHSQRIIDQLKSEKEEIKKHYESMKVTQENLERKLKMTEESLFTLQNEKKHIETKYQELIDENKTKLHEVMDTLKIQNEDLSNNLSNKFEAMKITQDTLEETKLQLKNNNQLLTDTLEILQKKLTLAEDSVQKLKAEKEELETKYKENLQKTNYSQLNKEDQETIAQLNNEKEEIRKQYETLRNSKDTFEQKLVVAEESLSGVKREKETIERENTILRIKNEELEKNQKKLEEYRRELSEVIDSLKNQNEALSNKFEAIKTLQEILDETRIKVKNNNELLTQTIQHFHEKQRNSVEIAEQKPKQSEEDILNVQNVKKNLEIKHQTIIDENKRNLDEAINNIRVQNDELSKKFETIKVTQETLEETKLQIKDNSQLLNKALEILQEKLKNAEDFIQKLRIEKDELEKHNKENSLNHVNLKVLSSQLEKNNKELIDQIKAEKEEIKMQNDELKVARGSLEEKLRIAEKSLVTLQNEKENLERKHETLSMNYEELQKKLAQLEENKRDLDELIKDLKNHKNILPKEINVAKETQETSLRNKDILSQVFQIIQEQTKTAQELIEKSKLEKQDFENKYKSLCSKYEELQNSHAYLENNQKVIDELKKENEEMKNKYETSKAEKKALEEAKLQLQNTNKKLGNDVNDLQDKLDIAEKAIEKLESSKKVLESKFKNLIAQEKSHEMIKVKENQEKLLLEMIVKLKNDNATLKTEYEALTAANHSVREKNVEMQKTIEMITKTSLESSQKIKIEKEALETKYKQLYLKYNEIKNNHLTLDGSRKQLEEIIRNLKHDNELLTLKYEELAKGFLQKDKSQLQMNK